MTFGKILTFAQFWQNFDSGCSSAPLRSALYSSPAKIEHSPTDFQSSKMYLKTQP